MASQINPALINGTYPVQGVDNPSQGLRTNFTNTQLNFAYAAQEITDLQNKCLLKAPLSGGTANNSMGGSILNGGQLQNFSEVAVQLGTQSGTVNINYASGHYQTMTTGGWIDIAISNWPTTGSKGWITLQFRVIDVTHRIRFPTGIGYNAYGITGYDQVNNLWWPPATGYYEFTFESYDGGFTYTVSDQNNTLQPMNSSWEDLLPNNGASLAVGTSVVTTTTGYSVASLASGVEGQTKIFAMYQSAGPMVITVQKSAWNSGSVGTVTLSNNGDTVTLKYIKGRWFCIARSWWDYLVMFSDHPLVGSLEDLTEQELCDKIAEIYKKMAVASRMNNAWLYSQLAMALNNYQNAYQEKLRKDPDIPFSSVIDIS